MTIVAYRDGIMAADSVGWTGSATVKSPVAPKIKRLPDGGLIGCGGNTSEIVRVCAWMINPSLPTPTLDKDECFSAIWVKPDGSLWLGGYDLNFYQLYDQFFAIGSPTAFVFGALHAGASAEAAVQLAIDHTDSVGGKIQVERLTP